MPRVLRIVNRFNLGGPTYNACYLTKYLSPEYETLLIGGQKEAEEASSEFIPRSLGVDYTILPELQRSISFSQDRKAYQAIKALIRDFKPDLVHTHASKAGALGRLAASNCGVSSIVHTFHGTVFDGYFGKAKSNFYKQAERYLARKSDAIVAISPLQQSDLIEKYRIAEAAKIRMIHLGFDLSRFTQGQDVKRIEFREHHNLEDQIAVGIIGRLTPIKNHKFFLDSLVQLLADGFNFKAFVIGGGELESKLQTYTASIGLSNHVVFTSWIEDVSDPLAGLDIVALTSINEGTPVSLIEAQAAARPVISLNVGGVSDVVEDSRTGFVTSQSEFVPRLKELITDANLRLSMGQQGRQFALKNFGVERLASEMKILYQELLSI